MTTEHQASRTLVKSPPELWAECSDAALLARHIGEFGEIRITRLEPETAIDWEGELATGTVTIEPSGWGTRVTLTVQTAVDGNAQAEADDPVESAADGLAQTEQRPVLEQEAAQAPAEPQITATESVEEDADEKMEATHPEPDPALGADPDPVDGRWRRLIKRTRSWFAPREREPEPEVQSASAPAPHSTSVPPPDSVAPPPPVEPSPEPAPEPSLDPDAILTAALDSLGQAHHRPFSRA